MINDKRITAGPRGVADTVFTDSFDALKYNPVRSSTDVSDVEFFNNKMGMLAADRVAVRNFYRQRYGTAFRAEFGRDMNDSEVDGELRIHYNITDEAIDYTDIKEKQLKEYQLLNGDAENMEWYEYFTGTLGAFLESTENIATTAVRAATLVDFQPPITPLFEVVTSKDLNNLKEERKKRNAILSSKVDEFIKLVPEGLRQDLEELRVRAGDESVSSLTATLAAFLSNAPNLAAGFLPYFSGVGVMFSAEKESALNQFEDLFDVPRILPDDASDDLVERYYEAHKLADLYASGSSIIEYAQTGALKKLAGFSRLKAQKLQRQFAGTILKKIGMATGNAAENISEEISQQFLNNAIYNYGVKIANEKYGLDKQKISMKEGIGDSALGASRITAVTSVIGGVKIGISRRNYRNETASNLEEAGFSKEQAKQFANDMLNTADNAENFKETAQKINEAYEKLDIQKKAQTEQKKSGEIYDETGLITKDGDILTNADFDRFATLYNETQLRDLIKDESNKQAFVDAVYGDVKARNKYNLLIMTHTPNTISLEAPGQEQTEDVETQQRVVFKDDKTDTTEYEIDQAAQLLIDKIYKGELDDKLEVPEGQTIEQARETAIKQVLEKRGRRIEQPETNPNVPEKTKPKQNKNKQRRLEKERKKMVTRAQSSLRTVAPNIKIEFAKDNDDFIKRTGVHGNGFYDMKDTIILNPETANKGTVVHEVVHAVFHTKFKTDINIRRASDRILNEMLKHSLPESTRKEIQAFQQLYIEKAARLREEGKDIEAETTLADLNEEGIAQIASILTNNYDALKPSLKAQIQDFFAYVFKGVIPVSNEGRAIQLMKVLAGNTVKGERILEEDLSLLDEIGQEIVPGYQSPTETGFSAGKFQLSHSDIYTRMTYYYDIDSEKWQRLESDGNVTKDRSITDFKDKFIILHQPDAMFSGSIERNGRVLVKGKGGLYYPLKFNEEGYFWASTESGASRLVARLNEASQANGGKVLMALTSSPRQKVFGSTAGANAILEVFDDIVSDNNYDINRETFNKIIQLASIELGLNTSDLSVIRQRLGVTETSFKQRNLFVDKLIREIGKEAKRNPKFGKELLKFYESIQIFDRPESEVLKGQKKKELSAARIAKSKGQQGDLGTVGLRHLAEMLTEPLLKNAIPGEPTVDRKMGGHIYAVLEVDGPVELVRTDGHESYPFAIRSKDGKSPVIHILKDRHMWDTAVVNPDTDSYYESKTDKDLIYDTRSGVSGKPLKVKPRGKAQLSDDRTPPGIWKYQAPQQIGSAKTSLKQVSAVYKKYGDEFLVEGATVLDIGGGAFDLAVELGAKKGANVVVFDPYNRSVEHNESVVATVANGNADTVLVPNVLNVIKEKGAREQVIQQADNAIKNGGKIYFQIFEGDKSNKGRETTKGYQNNRKTVDYVKEIESALPDYTVERKGNYIIATRPEGKAQRADGVNAGFLFAGMGTVEIQLLQSLGINVVQTAEIEQGIVDVYNKTHNSNTKPVDVLKLKIDELKEKAIDFLHMSPPCQAFSAARNKGTVTEEDYQLEMKIARKLAKIIKEVQPKNLTIENVPAYQSSDQYAVIRKALSKAGYKVEELTINSADYGGNSSRHRLIVRASKTSLPPMPQQSNTGDWYQAMMPFIKDAPVDEAIQFEGRSGNTMIIVTDLLARIEGKQYDPNVAYICPGGRGSFKPQGEPGDALTSNFSYDAKKRKQGIKEKKTLDDGSLKGSSQIVRVALPVRQMVREKGLKYTANYYGATVKQIKEANDGIGYLVKRATTPMILSYMNLPTNTQLSGRVELDRAMLGNGIQGVITEQFIKPMVGKAQLSDDILDQELDLAQQELDKKQESVIEKENETLEEPEDTTIEVDEIESVDEFVEIFVSEDNSYLDDDERIEGKTRLVLEEIKILMRNLGLGDLPREQAVRFATLIHNASKDCNPNDVLDLANQALDEDLILSDQQHAMIVYRVTQLRNELDGIRDSMEGAQHHNTTVDLSIAYEAKLAEISKLVRADARSGSATGRALNARRIALDSDYSLVGVTRRALRAKNRLGNTDDLTPEELKKLADVQKPWQETKRKIEELKNKQQTTVRVEDQAAGQKFVEAEKKKRKTAVAKKSLSQKDKLIKRLQNRGYNIQGFGKSQLFNISPSMAKDIRDIARILVYEGYNNLDQVVNEIKGLMPDVLEFDIYGAISGRVQRIPKTESEAKKVLKRLTLQSDLMVQIDMGLQNMFDPARTQKPKSSEIVKLRKQLDELKQTARQNAKEDAAATRMLNEIDNINKMIDGLYRDVRKPSPARSKALESMADKLFTKRAELRAQDRLILLKTIIDYGEPPKFANKKRVASSQLLERYRAEITKLEKSISENRKLKNQEEARKRKEAEQLAQLESLSQQVAGWYRDNVAPKQQKQLSDVQLGIKEKQRLLKQQDRIAELTEILETGKMPEKDKPQLTDPMGYNETIKDLQEQIRNQEWYQQMQQMRFEEKRKEAVKAKIAEQERILTEGDFSTYLEPKEKKEILDPELRELLEVQRMHERQIRRAINELKPKTSLEKVADWASLPRAFMATADMSATLRQAFLLGVRHPVQFVKAIKTSAKAMINPSFANQVMTILENDNMSLIRESSGLFFSVLDTGLNTSEEAFSSGALEKIYKLPGVGKPVATVMGASERHMVIMLNVMRAATFDAFYEANPNATKDELKSMAHYINTASGRGDLYALEGAAQALSAFFFSPRFAMSRFAVVPEAVTKVYKGKVKGEEAIVADEIAKQWGALAVTTSIVYGLALLAGAEVGDDPEEADFGQLIFGNTRVDIFAGMGPAARLVSKFADAGIKRISGEEVSVDLSTQVLNTLFKYKASPWISGTIELATGKRYVTREEISAGRVLIERTIPISLSNIFQNIEDDAAFNEIAAELSGEFLGLSVYTREPKRSRRRKLTLPTY